MTGEVKTAALSWLDEVFPEAAKQRENQQAEGFRFAQKYLVFMGPTADPRARDLLEQWTKAIRRKVLGPDASPTALAAHNALREWVEGIYVQAEMAAQAQQPVPRASTP